MATPSSNDSPPARKRSLWRKLLRAAVLFSFILLIALALSLWALWSNRESILSAATKHLPCPIGVDVQDIEFQSPTHVILKGIHLHDKDGGVLTIDAEEAEWKLDAPRLLSGHLGTLRLKSPTIHVAAPPNPALLVTSPEEAAKPPKELKEKPLPAFSWDELQIDDGVIEIDPAPGRPGIRAKLQASGGAFSMADAKVSGTRQTLSLSDLQLAFPIPGLDERQELNIPTLETTFTPSPNGEKLIIEGLEIADLNITPSREVLASLFAKKPAASAQPKNDEPSKWPLGLPPLDLQNISLQSLRLDLPGLSEIAGLPAYANHLSAELNWQGSDLHLSPETAIWGEHEITLTNFRAGDQQDEETARFKKGSARLNNNPSTGQLEIDAEINSPTLNLELAQFFSPETTEEGESIKTISEESPAASTEPPILLKRLLVDHLQLQLRGGEHPRNESLLPDVAGEGTLKLTNIPLGKGSSPTSSESLQEIHLSQLAVSSPGSLWEEETKSPPTPLSLKELNLVFSPHAFTKETLIEKLTIEEIDLDLTKESASWLFAKTEESAAEKKTPSTRSKAPFHERLRFAELNVADGSFKTADLAPSLPHLQSEFQIAGTSPDKVDLKLTDLRAREADAGWRSFSTAKEINLSVHPETLWEKHRISELQIDGGTLIVGDELRNLLSPKEKSETAESQKKLPAKMPWSIDHVAIDDTEITLEGIAKGLPPVPIILRTEVNDLPLSADALSGNFDPQRIELAELIIPSPHRGITVPVLKLDTVFVEFTFDGLLRQEIESVEVVSPKIFVGEDLFWYIRTYREEQQVAEAKTQKNPPIDPQLPADATPAIPPDKKTTEENTEGWTVKKIAAYGGKMTLAPRGHAIEKLSSPFPFSTYTDMENGTMEAKLVIPKDNYPAPSLDLMLVGLTGEMEFSLPVKGIDNNLVETLWVDSIRFKQFETGKAFLSLTYDAFGVYGSFGGDIYGGYLNGGFNVYMNEEYTWDCWAAATGIEAAPVTTALTPEVFLAEGITDWEVVANGNIKELFQANGKFKSQTPGSINILKFDELVSEIPDGWGSLQRGLSELGMQALRDFSYDEGSGEFRIMGREGELDFLFIGPDGRRKVDLNVFDHRHPTPESKSSDTVAASPKPTTAE